MSSLESSNCIRLLGALEVSVRLRYVAPLPEALEQRIVHILGTLVRLSFPRQGAG